MYRSHSPNMAPRDYYVFLLMAIDFAGQKFVSREASENRHSCFFFTNRDESFV